MFSIKTNGSENESTYESEYTISPNIMERSNLTIPNSISLRPQSRIMNQNINYCNLRYDPEINCQLDCDNDDIIHSEIDREILDHEKIRLIKQQQQQQLQEHIQFLEKPSVSIPTASTTTMTTSKRHNITNNKVVQSISEGYLKEKSDIDITSTNSLLNQPSDHCCTGLSTSLNVSNKGQSSSNKHHRLHRNSCVII